jgi:23S rRNA (guanosine2251-2'-O)-methyltransferase
VKEWIGGRNPVYEALRAHRRPFSRLLIAKGVDEKGRLTDIQQLAGERKLMVERAPRQQLDSLVENHQGVALQAGEYPYSTLQDILSLAKRRGEASFILVLDVIQDPQNLGTLLRTAEAVGVHGVLLPLARAAGVTPAVVHASAGACEHMLVAQLNLAQAIETLKSQDIWVAGLEGSEAARLPEELRLDGPLAIVVGSEGEGLRPLVRQGCDYLLRLPMRGKVESLNAAVAGSVALYLALAQRSKKA